jgi:CcmD family protein
MYTKLLLGYGAAFALLVGYLAVLQHRLGDLKHRLEDLEAGE